MNENNDSPSRWMTVREIADDISVTVPTVWSWINNGILPARRFSARTTRVLRSDYEMFVATRPRTGSE